MQPHQCMFTFDELFKKCCSTLSQSTAFESNALHCCSKSTRLTNQFTPLFQSINHIAPDNTAFITMLMFILMALSCSGQCRSSCSNTHLTAVNSERSGMKGSRRHSIQSEESCERSCHF